MGISAPAIVLFAILGAAAVVAVAASMHKVYHTGGRGPRFPTFRSSKSNNANSSNPEDDGGGGIRYDMGPSNEQAMYMRDVRIRGQVSSFGWAPGFEKAAVAEALRRGDDNGHVSRGSGRAGESRNSTRSPLRMRDDRDADGGGPFMAKDYGYENRRDDGYGYGDVGSGRQEQGQYMQDQRRSQMVNYENYEYQYPNQAGYHGQAQQQHIIGSREASHLGVGRSVVSEAGNYG